MKKKHKILYGGEATQENVIQKHDTKLSCQSCVLVACRILKWKKENITITDKSYCSVFDVNLKN